MYTALTASAKVDMLIGSICNMKQSIFTTFNVMKDRYNDANSLLKANGANSVYEFGVYSGNGLEYYTRIFTEHNLPVDKFIGFDSFLGLPDEAEGIHKHPDWFTGAFNSLEYHSVESIQAVIDKILTRLVAYKDKIDIVKGFYQDSLTAELAEKMKHYKPYLVSIDVDIYRSAKEVLHWLVSNKLLIPGTFVHYDDWDDGDRQDYGEGLAHNEITKQFNLKWNKIHTNTFEFLSYE